MGGCECGKVPGREGVDECSDQDGGEGEVREKSRWVPGRQMGGRVLGRRDAGDRKKVERMDEDARPSEGGE